MVARAYQHVSLHLLAQALEFLVNPEVEFGWSSLSARGKTIESASTSASLPRVRVERDGKRASPMFLRYWPSALRVSVCDIAPSCPSTRPFARRKHKIYRLTGEGLERL